METPIGEEEDSHLGDFIKTKKHLLLLKQPPFICLKSSWKMLDTLTPEEKVLRLRFGLDDGRSRTLEEVGHEFGVTRNH